MFEHNSTTYSYFEDSTRNKTSVSSHHVYEINIVTIISTLIASVGIIANLTVVVAFLNIKKLRLKIPNIFIINQVRGFCVWVFSPRRLSCKLCIAWHPGTRRYAPACQNVLYFMPFLDILQYHMLAPPSLSHRGIRHCMRNQTYRTLSSIIFTARVCSMTERLCFDTCLSVCPREGVSQSGPVRGVPHPALDGGGVPQPGPAGGGE